MARIYRYVGAEELRGFLSERQNVRQPQDVRDWIRRTGQSLERGNVTVTFIVDTLGSLWIADRHSEHIACAAGQSVFSAGEMTFGVTGDEIYITAVSNQSLGYCPEPESWPAVAAALESAGISAPPYFTDAFLIRVCENCGMKNIVKDGVYECGVCGNALPIAWNIEPSS